jgi:hypothetical protein
MKTDCTDVPALYEEVRFDTDARAAGHRVGEVQSLTVGKPMLLL